MHVVLGIYAARTTIFDLFCCFLCWMIVVVVAFCPFLSLGRSSRSRLIKYLSSRSLFLYPRPFIHPFIYISHRVCKLDTCSREGKRETHSFCASSSTSMFFFSCICVTLSLAGSSSSSSSHCRHDGRVRSRQRRLFSPLPNIVVVEFFFPMRRALLLSIVDYHIH